MTKVFQPAPCPLFKKGHSARLFNFNGRIECEPIIDFGSDPDELAYFRVNSTGTSGTLIALRSRAESNATSTGMDVSGFECNARVNAGKKAGRVEAFHTKTYAKAGSELSSALRGGEVEMEIEAGCTLTANDTDVIGLRVRQVWKDNPTVGGDKALIKLDYTAESGTVELDAAIIIECEYPTTKPEALTCLIDSTKIGLKGTGSGADEVVTLFKFLNEDGTVSSVTYKKGDAALAVVDA